MPWELFQISYDASDPEPESLYVRETLAELMEKEHKELKWFIEEYGEEVGIKSYETMPVLEQPKWDTQEIFSMQNARFKVADDEKTEHMYTSYIGTCLRWVTRIPIEKYIQYLHKKIKWHIEQKEEYEEKFRKTPKNRYTIRMIKYHEKKVIDFRQQLATANASFIRH